MWFRRPCQLVLHVIAGIVFVACARTSPSDPGSVPPGGCATDFSCAFGEECVGSTCAPIATSLYPHIQTASCLFRSHIDDAERDWRASHFDLLIGIVRPDEMRALNPNAKLFEYALARYHRLDLGPKTAADWAIAHGYDPEDFYLHYREDVFVPTWEGRVIVPGFPPGLAPGWNPSGGGNPASATERSQSRVVAYYNGSSTPWHLANIAHPGYRRFFSEHVASLIDGTWYFNTPFATGPVEGVMVDEALYYPQFGEGQLDRTTEYYGVAMNDDHPHALAFESLYPYLTQELQREMGGTKDLMPNYGHVLFLNYPNRSAINVRKITPWIWGEVWVTYNGLSSPTSGGNRCITYERDYTNGVRQIIEQTHAGGRRVVGARDLAGGGSGSDRGKLFTLGLYYLTHNRHTYYMYETGSGHSFPGHVSTWSWNPAVEYDIGQPDVIPPGAVDFEGRSNTKEHYEFATGADPYAPSLTYHLLARRFTGALVLVKMLPDGSVVDDRSITTHALDGTYAVLQADGSPGAIVTEAAIRNNEALILIRLD